MRGNSGLLPRSVALGLFDPALPVFALKHMEHLRVKNPMRWEAFAFVASLLVLVLLGTACSREQPERSAEFTEPYPKGAWRLGRHHLDEVALTFSHLLVMHRDSKGEGINLRAPDWHPDVLPQRTRQQALERAIQIASEARAAPEHFAELVAKYSEDVVTKDRGGSLGTWTAPLTPGSFLDAFQVMKPGEVSRVVETPLGFHILQLRDNPVEQKVAARRVLVSYDKTSSFWKRDGKAAARTRREAFELASRIAEEARKNPTSFAQLVDRYSEHADFLLGGYIGVWSTHNTFLLARELEVISNLQVGQTSDPLDGPEGFSVFIRDAVSQEVPVAYLQIAPGLRGLIAEAEAPRWAEEVEAMLTKDPESFDALAGKYCCSARQQSMPGRGPVPALEAVAAHLAIGQVATTPVKLSNSDYRFIKRVEPKPVPSEGALSGSLPAPSEPDLQELIRAARDGNALANYIAFLHQRLGNGLGIGASAADAAKIGEVLDALKKDLGTASPESRMGVISRAQGEMKNILGAGKYGQYYARLMSELKHQLAQ